jgi:hypothetical protein
VTVAADRPRSIRQWLVMLTADNPFPISAYARTQREASGT